MESQFQKTVSPNGLRVLTERHDHVQSATLGLWVQAGSVYETPAQSGIAHLLEHMVFKGTRSRTARQIARDMDCIGGQMNAFTEREFVCFHVKTLAEHADLALELLCELATSPNLEASDLDIEKSVILEEIRSVEDVPEELAEDLFAQTIWPGSRWGRPILGDEKVVEKLTCDDLRAFMKAHYAPGNVLVSAVGDIDHAHIARRAQTLLRDLPGEGGGSTRRVPAPPKIQSRVCMSTRDVEQVHLVCGTRGYANTDPKRFAAFTLDTILTGGYSSRLFQEVREKRGLCYSIGSAGAHYRDGGYWAVATSVAPEAARKTAKIIGKELRRVRDKGVGKAELARVNQMTRANMLLAEESSSAQMSRIARNELYYGRQRSTMEVLGDVLAVSRDDIQAVAREMFSPDLMTVAAVGPFEKGAKPLQIDVD
jgi:predicted Zn-dependent peptidase